MQCKKYIALYVRLSIEDRDVKRNDAKSESDSIAHQRKLLYDFVRKHPEWADIPVREFKDDGFTGSNFARPQFIELMSEVRKGAVDTIIVKDFSRLGRDYLEAGNFLDRIFPSYGVRFIAVNDRYDSENHIGQTTGLDVSLHNIINDMYSKDISVKCKSAQMVRYKRGEHVTALPFYGYAKNPEDKHKLVVDDEAAEVVKRIFQYSADGLSTYEIAALLNKEGVLSPYEYKKRNGVCLNSVILGEKALWNGAKIKVMIKDERYLGKMVSRRTEIPRVGSKKTVPVPKEEWIVVEGTHEPIVSQELFDAANGALSKRSKRAGRKGEIKRINLFTCPYCKHKLQFSGGADNRKYLFCGFAAVNHSRECQGIKLETAVIEQTVLYTINTLGNVYLEKRKRSKLRNEEKKETAESKIAAAKANVEKLKVERRNAYMRYSERRISRGEYMKLSAGYNEKLQELEHEIAGLEERSILERQMQLAQKVIEKEVENNFLLETFDAEQLRNVLDAIYVSADGSVELSFCRADLMTELEEKQESA